MRWMTNIHESWVDSTITGLVKSFPKRRFRTDRPKANPSHTTEDLERMKIVGVYEVASATEAEAS